MKVSRFALGAVLLLEGAASAETPEVIELSMRDAIRAAIERSPQLEMLEQDVARTAALIGLEEGLFDPSLIFDLRGTYVDEPGGTSTFTELRIGALGTLGLEGRLITGTRYLLALDLLWEDVDSAFAAFQRGQTLRFRAEVAQPLLRGGWLTANRAPILIRTIEDRAARALSLELAAELLARVEATYWRLVLAHGELSVQRDALELAERQVVDSRGRLRLGSVSNVQVLEAEAAVSRRQGAIEAANGNIAAVEAELLALILPPDKATTEITIRPTDEPAAQPLTTSAVEDLEAAYASRLDLAAARARIEAADAALALARNELLPSLDLVVGGSVVGFSGELSDRVPLDPNADPNLVGEFVDVFPNTRNPSAFVGLRLGLPLTNERAEAAEQIATADRRRREAEMEELKRRIYREIIEARHTLQADLKRVEHAKVLVQQTEALLSAQQQSFRGGAAVSFDVVRATVDVTRARIQLLRALVTAEISHSRLLLAKGQYLSANNIEIALGSK